MANSRFKADNGLVVSGANAEFYRDTRMYANLFVNADAVLITGNLTVQGNLNYANLSYTGDVAPVTDKQDLGNTTNRFDIFAYDVEVYGSLVPSTTTKPLGNTTRRWELAAQGADFGGNVSITGGELSLGTGTKLKANGGYGSAGEFLASNGTAVFWTSTTGYTGSRGDLGYTGSQGPIGYTGSQGSTGATGTTGAQGPIGYTGSAGTNGTNGTNGAQGPIGYTGSKGDTGSTGATGATGAQGPIGYTGSKGDTGATGAAGTNGAQGPIGYTGSRGDVGYTGSAGSYNQSLNTTNSPTFAGLTINGSITATGDITAYYSDDRLKNRMYNIYFALQKVRNLSGFYFKPNSTAIDLGFPDKQLVGVSAQEVQNVLPEVVSRAPISEEADVEYLTVQYDKMIPLLIEAIKELANEVDMIKSRGA